MRGLYACAFIVVGGCSNLLGIEPLRDGDGGVGGIDGPTGDAAPHFSLTLRKAAGSTGEGAITAASIGLACDAACTTQTIELAGPTAVELLAAPAEGTFFQGWSGPCHGPSRHCTVMVDGDVEVGARLTSTSQNLIFATAEKFGANLGGVSGADAKCANAAQAAGLAGIWVAVVSVENGDNAPDHILMNASGSLGGFIRLDGAPVIDDLAALVNDKRLLYPVAFDEVGERIPPDDDDVWTGSGANMFWSGASCGDWAATTGTGTIGSASAGPGRWMNVRETLCTNTARLYCVAVNHATAVTLPAPTAGKQIFVSNADVTFDASHGVAQADAACAAGKAGAHALLATNTVAATTLIDPSATYVRPDGVPIGTGAELIAVSAGTALLDAGPWQTASGVYLGTDQQVWTGGRMSMANLGDSSTTCSNWSSGSNKAETGAIQTVGGRYWSGQASRCDATGVRALCVEP